MYWTPALSATVCPLLAGQDGPAEAEAEAEAVDVRDDEVPVDDCVLPGTIVVVVVIWAVVDIEELAADELGLDVDARLEDADDEDDEEDEEGAVLVCVEGGDEDAVKTLEELTPLLVAEEDDEPDERVLEMDVDPELRLVEDCDVIV